MIFEINKDFIPNEH